MRRTRKMLAILALVLLCAGATAGEFGTFASMDELRRVYACWEESEWFEGEMYFQGFPREDTNTKVAPHRIYRVTSPTLEVNEVLRDVATATISKWGNIGVICVDPENGLLALTPGKRAPEPQEGRVSAIIVCDLDTQTTLCTISDGRQNFPPVFSPDGKYFAYRSSGPEAGVRPQEVTEQAACCVVRTATGKAAAYVPPFPFADSQPARGPALWLDAERVVFTTRCTEKPVIKAQAPGFGGDVCPGMALVHAPTGEVRWFLTPPVDGQPLNWAGVHLDRERGRILVTEGWRQIWETSWDFEGRKLLLRETNPDLAFRLRGVEENGELILQRYKFGVPTED